MTIPSFSISATTHTHTNCISVIGLVGSGDTRQILAADDLPTLSSLLDSVGATSTLESLTRIPHPSTPGSSIAVMGLGSALTPDALRNAAGAATRKLRSFACIEFALGLEDESHMSALLEGALLGAYSFTRFKSKNSQDEPEALANICIRTNGNLSDAHQAVIREKVAAIALVKDLVNIPPSELTPVALSDLAVESCAGLDLHVTVWSEEDLVRERLGGILGVGRGSANPPRLVKVSYRPQGATRHVALVGKGITFDTGGLSLKTPSGMVGMKYDMTGAATSLAVIRALAAIGANVHVTAWLCLAENMPSGTAIKPNDILTIRNGKTVEVLNTDAEGRLVLADGLSLASEEHPDLIIDIATLTGAARGALGTRTVPAMGNTDDVSRLVESAASSGEQFWRMPLPDELGALLSSEIADMVNAKPGNTVAGMLVAGTFLREFVGNAPDSVEQIAWIHLDVAGTADNPGSPFGFTGAGPTGVTVRSLIDFLISGA